MNRREFISLIGGAPPLLWLRAARAQQSKKIPRIGVLWPNPPATFEFMAANVVKDIEDAARMPATAMG